ncbi:sulfotransferase domain-containing protein [Virgibacillus sp. L01]|uniref:sulfotransferase domain-containing protein n=1 Tax=Virgibacillus sp. L01 TaxID=3457429 RepID=UPI003FD2E911
MGFPPEVFLIGAQKSGTTTLASLLDSHPNISVSQPKETHYFTINYDKGIDWYKNRFVSSENMLVDASTSYTMARFEHQDKNPVYENIPFRVYSLNPKAKFIYILRNPIDRAYSAYWHSVKTDRTNESFGKLIRSNRSLYLDTSNYSAQLSLWLKFFPLDSFLFIDFKDLKVEPKKTIEKCFEFMEVESDININPYIHKNGSYMATTLGKKINRLKITYPFINNINIGKVIPTIIKHKLLKKPDKITKMDDNDREYLINYFYEKNKRLAELTGLRFEHWDQ